MRCSFKEQSAEEGLWWEDQPGKGGEGQTQARARPSLETAEGQGTALPLFPFYGFFALKA